MQVNRISVSVFLSIILFVSVAANLLTNAVGYINTDKDESFTHTVFAEYSSLSYCGYCPAASSQLWQQNLLPHQGHFAMDGVLR